MEEILRLSKQLGLSHIGSCLNAYPVLKEIYERKPFRVGLGGAHAHLAHLIVKDEFERDSSGLVRTDFAESIEKYGIHCDRRAGGDISGGSLGHSGGILLGIALAHPDKDIYWIITDGEA